MTPASLPDEYMDTVVAAAEIVGRSGGREFEVGLPMARSPRLSPGGLRASPFPSTSSSGTPWLYDDEDPPSGAPPSIGPSSTAASASPAACERLAARVRQKINLVPEQGRWADGNCNWHREGKHWLRGCDSGHGPLPNREQRRRR